MPAGSVGAVKCEMELYALCRRLPWSPGDDGGAPETAVDEDSVSEGVEPVLRSKIFVEFDLREEPATVGHSLFGNTTSVQALDGHGSVFPVTTEIPMCCGDL